MIPALESFLIFEQLMITMRTLVTAFLLPVKLAQRILWHPFSVHRSWEEVGVVLSAIFFSISPYM